MGLKIVKNFDGRKRRGFLGLFHSRVDATFTLDSEAHEILFRLLTNKTFIDQISQSLQENEIVFTDLLFQPVPYSQHTPKGMPAEFERYHNCEEYIIINVPPSFMFQAKIFNPSRLCAIYRKI